MTHEHLETTTVAQPDPFSLVPDEILERVLAQLPAQDLFGAIPQVCARWRRIVRAGSFVPWKKAYHRFRKSGQVEGAARGLVDALRKGTNPNQQMAAAVSEVVSPEEIVSEDGGALEMVLPFLVREIARVFSARVPSRDWEARFSPARRHSKYGWTDGWIRRCLSELREGAERDAAAVAVLCVAAEDAWDVREIIRVFLAAGGGEQGSCSNVQICELLYSIAFAFLFLAREDPWRLPRRFHHVMAQALYIYESDWSYDASRRELPGSDITPTAEQMRIIAHPLDTSRPSLVKIVAFAGAGKTSTLVRLCERNPHLDFLVVVYNKSAQIHAERTFPPNATCLTAHSIAYRMVGSGFSRNKLTQNLTPRDIVESQGMVDRDFGASPKRRKDLSDHNRSHLKRASLVLRTIKNFTNSPDPKITPEHVPTLWMATMKDHQGKAVRDLVPVPEQEREWALEDANNVWSLMRDPLKLSIRLPHDGYLKLWQLGSPSLQDIQRHDVLLMDEGQDMNPAMLDVFMKQRTPKFIVGDPHQQIYAFRGAVNALDLVGADATYHLTQSFRFGPEIAFAAACCLEGLKGEDGETIVGGKKTDCIMDRDEIEGRRAVAVIGRTNQKLFREAVKLVYEKKKTGKFVGGVEKKFDDYKNLVHLSEGRYDRMTKWKMFKSLESLSAFSHAIEDLDVLDKIEFVRNFRDGPAELLKIVEYLEENCPDDRSESEVDFIFTTAHMAKGLEWENVVLLDDFFLNLDEDLGRVSQTDDFNVLYVAVTRARKFLAATPVVRELLSISHYHFERLEVPSLLSPCAGCSTVFDQHYFSLGARDCEDRRLCPTCCSWHHRDYRRVVVNPARAHLLSLMRQAAEQGQAEPAKLARLATREDRNRMALRFFCAATRGYHGRAAGGGNPRQVLPSNPDAAAAVNVMVAAAVPDAVDADPFQEDLGEGFEEIMGGIDPLEEQIEAVMHENDYDDEGGGGGGGGDDPFQDDPALEALMESVVVAPGGGDAQDKI